MAVLKQEVAVPVREPCLRHPNKLTGLHCNKCGDPICPKCAKRSLIGYTCPECKRKGIRVFYNGKRRDIPTAIAIALPLSLLVAFAFTFLPFPWFLALLAAPPVTGCVAEAVRYAVRRRRSLYLAHAVAGCLVVATLACLVTWGLITLPQDGFDPLQLSYALFAPGILLVAGCATIMARLR
jgi:hypothetical protein